MGVQHGQVIRKTGHSCDAGDLNINYITNKLTEVFIKTSSNRFEVEVTEKGNDRA